MKSVSAGMNPMDLKRGIDQAVDKVVADLQKRSKNVKGSSEISQVGVISANGDEELARKSQKRWKKSAKRRYHG